MSGDYSPTKAGVIAPPKSDPLSEREREREREREEEKLRE
jgi:hypothetical protein